VSAKIKLLCSTLVGLATAIPAHAQRPYTILPSSEARETTNLCSRQGIAKIDGGWEPSDADIKIVESHLDQVSRSTSDRGSLKGPTDYFRQYVGVIVSGRKLIYLNAIGLSDAGAGWKTRFVSVCDGGESFWGAIYDPATGKFADLHKNGPHSI
jgi:hypothetical protein